MQKLFIKTPLFAAFFCASVLVGCTQDPPDQAAVSIQCPASTAAIASVQGNAPRSTMLGQQVVVQGIVTLIQNGKGLYIEEPGSDTDERTSNAIFIQSTEFANGIEDGSLLSVRGEVSEIGEGRYPLTALTRVSEITLCSSNNKPPLTDISLPLNGLAREALEGMRVQLNDELVVTETYRFGRGYFTLSGNGFQFVPTEVMAPGPDAADLLAENKRFALPVMLPEETTRPELLVSGTTVNHIMGVVAHDDRGLRVSLQSISPGPPISFEAPPSTTADSLRIVGMNLHNYFNGDGNGLGFPTPRGAETSDGFQKQRKRIGAAIKVLDPHVLGVMELENDGFGADSAAQDFIQLANSATGKPWAVTRPVADNTGSDMITVGLFYRSDRLKAIGPAQTLTGGEFEKSRQPQAQLFQQLPDGEKVLVVINHLKSKGSCPESGIEADQRDGQGCWNPMRLASAKRMSAWANRVAAAAGTGNILILGDMNAYRSEDPVGAIRDAGFTELMDARQGEVYSFVYYGQHGTLDYAFASENLLGKVQQAFIWNVNAAFPADMELPQPWLRFSDHDPVVVDLVSRQSITLD